MRAKRKVAPNRAPTKAISVVVKDSGGDAKTMDKFADLLQQLNAVFPDSSEDINRVTAIATELMKAYTQI